MRKIWIITAIGTLLMLGAPSVAAGATSDLAVDVEKVASPSNVRVVTITLQNLGPDDFDTCGVGCEPPPVSFMPYVGFSFVASTGGMDADATLSDATACGPDPDTPPYGCKYGTFLAAGDSKTVTVSFPAGKPGAADDALFDRVDAGVSYAGYFPQGPPDDPDLANDSDEVEWTGSAEPPVSEPPIANKTVNVRTVKGIVKVKLRSEREFTLLTEATQIPVGSQLDTTAGRVEIVSASDAKGGVRTGQFYDGVFKVKQKKLKGKGATASGFSTVLQLVPNVGCAPGGNKQRGKKKKGGNGLWGSEKGGGHTSVGQSGSSSTRGTIWFVGDRCDGSTLARVQEGKVKFRDFVLDKTITLNAGDSYVAGGD